MPTIVQTQQGTVTGLWGQALIRGTDGRFRVLRMGDLVKRGDVLLTTQDGIVQLTPQADEPLLAGTGPIDINPAAGGSPDSGEVGEGLRVARIVEVLTPASLVLPAGEATLPPTVFGTSDVQAPVSTPTVPTSGTLAPPLAPPPSTPPAAPPAANAAPQASSGTLRGNEDTDLPVSLRGQDSDGSVTAVTVTGLPSGGQLLLADGRTPVVVGQVLTPAQAADLVFRPNPDFNGNASVGFTVTDNGGSVSPPATVALEIAPVNDPPLARPDQASGRVDTPLSLSPATLLANDSDAEGQALSIVSVGNATNGSVALVNGQIVFTPAAGYAGPASFSYTASDGQGGSATTSVTLDITGSPGLPPAPPAPPPLPPAPPAPPPPAPAQAPVGVSTVTQAAEDTPFVNLPLRGTDADGQVVSVTIAALPPAGEGVLRFGLGGPAVSANQPLTPAQAAAIVFEPARDFNGEVRVAFTVTDDTGLSSPLATARVTLLPVNDAPSAVDDLGRTPFATPIAFSPAALLANDRDVDGDPLALVSVQSAINGSVSIVGGQVVFVPDALFSGPASFTYTLSDGQGGSATATVNILVGPPLAPVANTYSATGAEDSPGIAVQLTGSDADGSVASVRLAEIPPATQGTLLLAAGGAPLAAGTVLTVEQAASLVFVPAADFNGQARVIFTVTDNTGLVSAPSAATLTITPVNDAPVANGDTGSTPADTALSFPPASLLGNDRDPDLDPLTIASVQQAVNGSVSMVGGNVVFLPTPGYTGPASFTYTVSDGQGGLATATVDVLVTPAVAAPVIGVRPVGYWTFNEGSGTATTNEWSGQTGGLADVIPTVGTAGDLPGWATVPRVATSGSFLDLTGSTPEGLGNGGTVTLDPVTTAPLASATSASLSFWIRTTANGLPQGEFVGGRWNGPAVISSESNGATDDIQWGVLDEAGRIGFSLGNQPGVFTADPINDGRWHHVVITTTGAAGSTSRTASVYLDGGAPVTGTLTDGGFEGLLNQLTGLGATNRFYLDSAGNPITLPGTASLQASLDDVRIYDRPLTADQVRAIQLVESGFHDTALANDGGVLKLSVTATGFTSLSVSGLAAGMEISDGVNSVTASGPAASVTLTGWDLSALQVSGPGSATLDFEAVNTVGGVSRSSHTALNIVTGSTLQSGTAGPDLLTGTAEADLLSGAAAADTLAGLAGNDRLLGGEGADRLSGGAGSDFLTGGSGGDVFSWTLADRGSPGTPAIDRITDFNPATPAGGGDVLDLRDLLVGESGTAADAGNLDTYIDFARAGGDTVVRISSTGGFTGGIHSAAAEDQRIVLEGVDLIAGLGLGAGSTDNQVLQELLSLGKLVTDGSTGP